MLLRRMSALSLLAIPLLAGCGDDRDDVRRDEPAGCSPAAHTGCAAGLVCEEVQGGDPACWSAAPYYDAAALQGGRIIIAAFTLDEKAPAGRVRVARIHLQESGVGLPDYASKLKAAAAPGGARIDAKIDVVRK